MVAKRIVACLDIKGGRTVKGVTFQGLRDMGDPVELAVRYSAAGIDELVFLDISATDEERSTTVDLVKRVARSVTIPFTVGGGISSVRDVARLVSSGADKVSINSSAVRTPELIDQVAREFGSQCVVVAIDSKEGSRGDEVYTNAGKVPTGHLTWEWAKEATERGAGEILLTSIDHDGVRKGFATELTGRLSRALSVPVIASGGAGEMRHFADVFREADADAALASGVFHERVIEVSALKEFLGREGIEVRV
jgi:imidazole glycerol-phosphate synthase subunit HisF